MEGFIKPIFFGLVFVVGLIYGIEDSYDLPFPDQVWNHIGPDAYGLIAPASTLWGRKFLLTGGSDGFKNHTETWSYQLDREDWTLTPDSVSELFVGGSKATSNVYRDYLFSFGNNPEGLEITQLRDGDEHVVFKGPGPHQRVGHTATLFDEDLIVYGGYDVVHEKYSNELWRANIRYGELHWELLEIDSPCGERAGHTAILYQDSLYIFGGRNNETFYNDVWRYDFNTKVWIRTYEWDSLANAPTGRVGHGAVLWSDECMYIWGGFDGNIFWNDMWKFVIQKGVWEKVVEGVWAHAGYSYNDFLMPSPRAYFGYSIFEGKLLVLGGQVTLGGVKEVFWSPQTRYVPISHPDDFAGDVWAFDFCSGKWEFIGCLAPWADLDNITSPLQCRSNFKPQCKNDCSGNGVCVRDGECICRGEWQNEDCSYNVCYDDPYLGYHVNLMDRILVTESVLNLGKNLLRLRDKLKYVQERLPPFDEFTTCVKFNPIIGKLVRDEISKDSVSFNSELEDGLVPISHEFNDVLEATADQDAHLPYHF